MDMNQLCRDLMDILEDDYNESKAELIAFEAGLNVSNGITEAAYITALQGASSTVRHASAKFSNRPRILAHLAQDESVSIRMNVAYNKYTSADTLSLLGNDSDALVTMFAVDNEG